MLIIDHLTQLFLILVALLGEKVPANARASVRCVFSVFLGLETCQ